MAKRHEPRNARPTVRATRPPSGKVGREVHRHLLADPAIRGWYEERALRSKLSADTYLRQLGGMAQRLQLEPNQIVKLAEKDPDKLHDLLVKYATDLQREGRLDSYIAKTFDGLRSWLRARRSRFDLFPRLSPARSVSLEGERVPTPEELRGILLPMSLRGQTSALFMAHAGLRPGVLGAYEAKDGLTLGDLPDLTLGPSPDFSELPFAIRVPSRLSKTRKAYTTFGTKELADTFKAYLKERMDRGEELTPRSPVVAADPLGVARGFAKGTGFLTTKGVVLELREGLKAHAPEGVRWRPYVLRAYCSPRLLMAEGAGKIARDLREAILGHDTGVAGRYNVGKTWGPELLREGRSAYKRAEPYLLTTGKAEDSQEAVTRALRLLLAARGVPASQLEGLDLAGKSDEEIVALLKTVGAAIGGEKRAEKAVSVREVPALLEAGWEFVSPLNGEMAVLRAPPASPDAPLGISAREAWGTP